MNTISTVEVLHGLFQRISKSKRQKLKDCPVGRAQVALVNIPGILNGVQLYWVKFGRVPLPRGNKNITELLIYQAPPYGIRGNVGLSLLLLTGFEPEHGSNYITFEFFPSGCYKEGKNTVADLSLPVCLKVLRWAKEAKLIGV